MKKNIFFIITSDLFIRNYIFTNALKEIEKHNNIYFLACDKNVTLKKEIKKKKKFSKFLQFYCSAKKKIPKFLSFTIVQKKIQIKNYKNIYFKSFTA